MVAPSGLVDTALPGVNSQVQATRRNLKVETVSVLGGCSVSIFWDIAAFYDSISLPMLARSAAALYVPPLAFALAGQMHLAPRHLKLGSAVSSQVAGMGRSIIAGCVSSTSLARALLWQPVADITTQASTAADASASSAQDQATSGADRKLPRVRATG